MCKLYRPNLPREAAAKGLLEVSQRVRLRKTPTDSSSGPSEEGWWEQQRRKVFIIVIIKYRYHILLMTIVSIMRPFMFVDLQYVTIFEKKRTSG